MRAIDQYGIAGIDATHAFDVVLLPKAPIAEYPQPAQVIREQKPTLRWQAQTSTTAYAVELATDKGFANPLLQARVQHPNMPLQQSLPAGEYHWRVATITQSSGVEQQSAWTSNLSFEVKPPPEMPDISQMQVKVYRNRINIDIPPPPDPLQYQFNLDNPKNNQVDVWVDVGKQTSYKLLLKEYGEQTLYVRLRDVDGATGSAAVYSFTASPP